MAFRITTRCSRCGACVDVCPVDAIQPAQPYYRILALSCTECVGFADTACCAEVCEPQAIQRAESI